MTSRAACLALVLSFAACNQNHDEPTPSAAATPSAASAGRDGIHWMQAPAGTADAASAIRDALAKEHAGGRTLLVYVGATWCEPCQRFHHAAERGELDATFPDVDLLGFDADHDAERLASAGYVSKLIPLFALPGPDGRASGKQVEGGIKGDGAVGFIAPRLEKMLAD